MKTMFFGFFIEFILLFLLIIPLVIIVHGIKKRVNIKKIVICWILICLALICFLHTDYIKSRKKVDVNWMLGKNIDIVRWRYSYPSNRDKYQEVRIINNKEYIFCIREIFEWNAFDGVLGESRYYVNLDENMHIADVVCCEWGGFSPASDYPYSARW